MIKDIIKLAIALYIVKKFVVDNELVTTLENKIKDLIKTVLK